jgi:hypothetical protein
MTLKYNLLLTIYGYESEMKEVTKGRVRISDREANKCIEYRGEKAEEMGGGDNIKMNPRKTDSEIGMCMKLVQDRATWRLLVSGVED